MLGSSRTISDKARSSLRSLPLIKLGLRATLVELPSTFWISNSMEILERTAWYAFFTLSSLYITGPISEGALGFSSEQRGLLQGVVTFFLYLFPVVSGALADRFGYRRMLLAAYIVLTPAYWLLGRFHSFSAFFLAFMAVAVGAGMFKPVVIGTVARVTDSRTASLGFGIFYMMVNVGGYIGPWLATLLREQIGWTAVFVVSTVAISLNFLVLLFYREPTREAASGAGRSLGAVFRGMVEVLGNGRLFLLLAGALLLIVWGGGTRLMSWADVGLGLVGWVALNFAYDFVLRVARAPRRNWLTEPIRLGNWRLGLYLAIISGFWTVYFQIMSTTPEYLRDFTDSLGLLRWAGHAFQALGLTGAAAWVQGLILRGAQIPPEQIVNLDAAAIVLFQIPISWVFARFHTFTTLIVGLVLIAISMVIPALGGPGIGAPVALSIAGVVVFAFGEMTTSPKSQEYVGSIAPPDKVALYMGYYFVCVALGNLFGGILSGAAYGYFARDRGRPDLMWLLFAALAVLTMVALMAYNRWALPRRDNEKAAVSV
jgi:POT family proton-dependent oligopeptide transporter